MVTKRLADLAMTLAIKSLSAILLYSMLNAISTTQSWYKGVEGGHPTPYEAFSLWFRVGSMK